MKPWTEGATSSIASAASAPTAARGESGRSPMNREKRAHRAPGGRMADLFLMKRLDGGCDKLDCQRRQRAPAPKAMRKPSATRLGGATRPAQEPSGSEAALIPPSPNAHARRVTSNVMRACGHFRHGTAMIAAPCRDRGANALPPGLAATQAEFAGPTLAMPALCQRAEHVAQGSIHVSCTVRAVLSSRSAQRDRDAAVLAAAPCATRRDDRDPRPAPWLRSRVTPYQLPNRSTKAANSSSEIATRCSLPG